MNKFIIDLAIEAALPKAAWNVYQFTRRTGAVEIKTVTLGDWTGEALVVPVTVHNKSLPAEDVFNLPPTVAGVMYVTEEFQQPQVAFDAAGYAVLCDKFTADLA